MTDNQLSAISYVEETEREDFEEFINEYVGNDKKLREIADRFLENGIIDNEVIDFLKDSGHIYATAVLAIHEYETGA